MDNTQTTPTAYDDMSLKQLQQILTDLNFTQPDLLPSKAACIAVILEFKKKEAVQAKAIEDAVKKAAVDAAAANPAGTALPVETPAQENASTRAWDGKKNAMKKFLDSQPKVSFVVPLEFGEKPGAYETVIMNGYRINIMKGIRVELPEAVVKHLEECYQMTQQAGSEYLINRDEKVEERLQG